MWRVGRSQDRNDGLTVLPSHLLNVLDGGDQITSTTRAHKESVLLDKEPGHAYRLRVRYPNRVYFSVNHSLDHSA